MDTSDTLLLARAQFGLNIAFHILFPTITIGLAWILVYFRAQYARTGEPAWLETYRLWVKVFALTFAMGVVTGIVMSFQFGTNWPGFMLKVGNIAGPLLAFEVLTAFFLEATFLGVMLFGWSRVPPWLHVTSAVLVAVGTLMSSFWIISANSWMQFPAGHVVRDGIAYPADWLAAIFNPTFGWRLAHMVTAAYLTTAFVVMAVGARYLLAGRFDDHARTMLRMGVAMAAVLAPLQLVIGDQHGLDVAAYQPAKLAAIEGHWNGEEPAALVLFAVPNEAAARNDYAVSIPRGASLVITHSLDGRFRGLNDFAPEDRPPVALPFFAFRVMVGIGFAMIALALWGAWLWWRGRLDGSRAFLRLAALSWPAGFIALLAGWTVTEVGRQPWLAAGILRTGDAASPVEAGAVAATLVLFVVVYAVVFAAGILYMNRLIHRGPTGEAVAVEGLASRPISAAEGAGRRVFGGKGAAP